jgi:hypothetical protein
MTQIKSNSNEIGFAEFLKIIHSRFQNGIKTNSGTTDRRMIAVYDHVLLGDEYHSIVFSYEKRTRRFFTYVFFGAEYDDVATSERDFKSTLVELSRSVNAGDYEC